MKGIYVLVIELDKPQEIRVGEKGVFRFQPGSYGYVGSALAGLERRMKRHLNPARKFHWHIDYLLDKAVVQNIIYAGTVEKKECALAREMSLRLSSVDGFGSSDCKCPSHLFFCYDRMDLENTAVGALKGLGLAPETSLFELLQYAGGR